MDQETKDEKEFLDEDLFDILQEVKGKIDRGELDTVKNDDDDDNDGAAKMSLGKLGKLAKEAGDNAN